MKWNLNVLFVLIFFELNVLCINTAVVCTDGHGGTTKRPYDVLTTDGADGMNEKNVAVIDVVDDSHNIHNNNNASTNTLTTNDADVRVPSTPQSSSPSLCNSDNRNVDDMQNDQPEKNARQPHYYGNIRRQPPSAAANLPQHYQQQQQSSQHHQHQQPHPHQQPSSHHQQNREEFNIEYTKEVIIKQGRLKGMVRRMHAQSGLKNVDQYLGIPYAAAPVGNGRFMPPGTPQPWQQLRLATILSPVCPQNLPIINGTTNQLSAGRYDQLKRLLPFLKNENEDCLFLNLYVPQWDANIDASPKFPIIIYIHGESYEWNSGNPYDGSVLASYGQVIVVTLNYRLGILGFLKPGTTDHTVSNFGLLDQIAALQWVKDNIGAFGGNNKAVTLMGHGTGAACVNLLMVSPVARGLFHRAILMSGSALSDWAIANHPLQTTMQVIRNLNCPLRDDHEELLTCLRKKRYQEILKTRISRPEFSTVLGPVVDNSVIPNLPHKTMGPYNGVFSQYDLLFGLTEIESYHSLNAVGLSHGLLESERDSFLRFYMQNQFDIRPNIALALTLQEYADIYNNPDRPQAEEHRDTVLEIISDARVAAPLVQTGLYHAKVNPRCYMYVFAHNSRAGEFANLPQSISGEDLPYVFGAPLASTAPFQSRFSPEERLLSESIMVYWTNFAKTGNPKAPSRDHFLNLEPKEWERYDIDWPEFNGVNLNYLNIGIPPVVNQKYKQKYMNFWNQDLPDELNRTNHLKPVRHYPELYASSPTVYPRYGTSVNPIRSGDTAHVNYFNDKSTEDPFRALKILLNQPKNEMYNTQSTMVTTSSPDEDGGADIVSPAPANEVIVRADATLHILIGIVGLFLLVNVVILVAYLIRRNYYSKNLQRKLDVLTLDGTTDDDLKRCKFNDGDESYILNMVRKKNNDYEPSRRNRSPINGFLLSRDISTSTVDAHTKVCDWMSQEINKQAKNKKPTVSPNFSLKSRSFFKRPGKVSVAIDATPSARSASVLMQQPAELMKIPSFDYDSKDTIICQEVDMDESMMNSVDLRDSTGRISRRNSIASLKGSADIIKIDHRHSRSDPVQMYYYKSQSKPVDEDITVFIEGSTAANDDVNVTSRTECSGERLPMSPEDALKNIQMRYPKVLPNYPENMADYVSSSIKRRSLPPQCFSMGTALKTPPAPPPRTTSTLGRRPSTRRESKNVTTSPIMMAEDPPVDQEPEITCNMLHVGPLIPKSNESLYSTIKRQPPQSPDKVSTFSFENSITIESINEQNTPPSPNTPQGRTEPVHRPTGIKPPSGQKVEPKSMPKIIIKPNLLRQNSTDKKSNNNITRVQAPLDASTRQSGSKIPTIKKVPLERDRSTSDSSTASSAETVKQFF